jgi:gliding motility-associated-like protein
MKLNKHLILLIFTACILCVNTSRAQNLLINPGFENFSGSPTLQGQLNLATPWVPLGSTPDLYAPQVNLPIQPCDVINTPYNVGGYTPVRVGGNAYAGISADPLNNTREYISSPLTVSLNAGELYRVEFWVQLADSSRFACNRLGVYFSNGAPVQAGNTPINFIPQIENPNIINDTSDWTLITGIYQASGTENYITIGVFRADGSPLLQRQDLGSKSTGCDAFDDAIYYFIDDVVVRPVNEVVEIDGDSVLCPGDVLNLFCTVNVPFWWSNSNDPTDTISTLPILVATPTASTTYYLNGIAKIDSVKVTFVNPPVINIGPDTLLCLNDSIKLDGFASDAVSYNWSTGDTTSFIQAKDTGVYYVDVYNTGCLSSDTIIISDYLENDLFDLGTDSAYCFFNGDTLYLNGPAADSYLWQPTGETTPSITVIAPAIYTLTATKSNGCKSTALISVKEICEPNVFIPSAFTPDDDGINDVFLPTINNVENFNFRIQNRRGQTVFFSEDASKGWDGKFNGVDAPIGVYVYRLNYLAFDAEGSKIKEKILGTITLIR